MSIVSRSHTHPSNSQTSRLLISFLSETLDVPVSRNPVYVCRVDPLLRFRVTKTFFFEIYYRFVPEQNFRSPFDVRETILFFLEHISSHVTVGNPVVDSHLPWNTSRILHFINGRGRGGHRNGERRTRGNGVGGGPNGQVKWNRDPHTRSLGQNHTDTHS